MSVACPDCRTQNRAGAQFCARCGKTITPGTSLPEATTPLDGAGVWQATPVVVPRHTVVRDDLRSPGTVLHSRQASVPVLGWLVILKGRRKGRDYRIDRDASVLGRDGGCDFVVEDDTVSRQHARIRVEDQTFVLFDLGSGNGTYVNGEQVQRVELQDGDVIKIGDSLILFKDAKPRVPLAQADVPRSGS